MGLQYSPKIVTNGLVMYMDAKNTKSYPGTGSTWFDISAGDRDSLAFNNMDNTNHNSDGFFNFNGTDENISVPDVVGADMTTDMWFQTANISGTRGVYGEGAHFRMYQTNGDLTWWSRETGSGTSFAITASDAVTADQWIYAAGSHESSNNMQLWINGEWYDDVASNVIFDTGTTTTAIGSQWIGSSDRFAGNIAIVRHYDRILSNAEIKQNFEAQRGRFGV